MNCAVCGSELHRDESWDGRVCLSCPLCHRLKSRSEKGRERPLYGYGRYTGDIVAQAEKIVEKGDK